jgi:TPR repeat protein
MINLDWLYDKGYGVSQDCDSAREWYQKAVEAGNNDAANGLGLLYQKGNGVAQDYGKAREWFQKANKVFETDAPSHHR